MRATVPAAADHPGGVRRAQPRRGLRAPVVHPQLGVDAARVFKTLVAEVDGRVGGEDLDRLDALAAGVAGVAEEAAALDLALHQ